ncbi:MAG: DNA-binding protein AraC-type [Herbinix sp.]|jgi:thiamine kinase-like enzyme|nr:DNA-binding protein AraC-type [Herbinix sp.]
MKYVNGADILPEELINEIRKYTDGVYIYIPKNSAKRNKWGENTNHRREMELRNIHIYDKYLEGVDYIELADCYHLSDKSIRRIVLSQKRRMEPVKAMMKEILKAWNIDDCPRQIYHSTWSVKESFVLKEYIDKNALQRNIQMHKILRDAGVPVPEVCPLKDGKEFYEKNDKMYILTTKLKGNNIVNIDKVNKSWFFELGQIIAKLHVAFRECEKTMSFWNNSLLEEMEGWVTRNLDEFKPEYLSINEITESIRQLSEVYKELPKQLIHRDVHLGNLLFDEMQFSGYIDFDLSQSNIRIFDICYFLLGLLLQEDNNRVNEECWFEIVSQVIDGYDSLANLKQVERSSVTCVMKNIELLFVAYFLGIGDEKSAKDSADLFQFVSKNEAKILDVVMK